MPKLTKTVVDSAEKRASDYFIWCDQLPGFGVRIFASGKRSYLVQYRAGGRSRRATIGLHGHLTADEARKEAKGLLGQVAKGGDPAEERATHRLSMTVAELCERYLAATEKGLILGKGGGPKKPLTLYADKGRIVRHIIPLLGRRRVRELTHADIARFIRDVSAGKTAGVIKTKKMGKAVVTGGKGTATRAAGLLGGILTYGVSEGVIPTNPAFGVKRPSYERRTARLSPVQYSQLGEALVTAESECFNATALRAIRLLLLTGCRKSEILNLRWSEVDAPAQALRLMDSKEGASVRPIGRAALALLVRPDNAKQTDHVLPGPRSDGEKPYGALPTAWLALQKKAGLSGVTLHTLRHSFASVAGDLGYSEATIAALLGHAAGSVTGRYVHHLDAVLVAAADRVAEEIWRNLTSDG